MPKVFLFKFILLALLLTSQNSSAATKTFVFLGDSLTEGYGVAQSAAFPALIQNKVLKDNLNWKIISSGSSGSTSASTLSRLKWVAKDKPDYVMILMGSNDGLRGFKVDEVEKNLSAALSWAAENKVKIILGGLEVPPNYGKQYAKDFHLLYPRLAKKFKVMLAPFLLDEVAGRKELNQSDGIHPNEKGHALIAEKMYSFLLPILKK